MTQSIRPATQLASTSLLDSPTSFYYLFPPPEIVNKILHAGRVAENLPPPPLVPEIAQKLLLWPVKSLRLEIQRIEEPDPVILNQIHLHEKNPGELWCALLERSIKAPGLRRWLLDNTEIVWLSREDAIGRASRILLQNAFDENVFQAWVQTKPPQNVLMQFFQDRAIRKKHLSDETLKHLSMLPLDYLAMQSLTHFPWERIKEQWEEKKPSWFDSLKKNLLQCPSIPGALKSLCSEARSPKAFYTLLNLVGSHPEESFLMETIRLARSLCKDHRGISLSKTLLQEPIERILNLQKPSTILLQECVYLLLHPFCKSLDEDRLRLFDLLAQRVIALFLNQKILGGASLHMHTCVTQSTESQELNIAGPIKTPLELPPAFEISAPTILEQAQAIVLHYISLDPHFSVEKLRKNWDHFQEILPHLTISFPFEGNDHLPLLKTYLKRLCTAKHDFTPLHWTFSLYAIHQLHKFAINFPAEATFSAEMMTEILFNSHFQKNNDQIILLKAVFSFETERFIKIPELVKIKSIFLFKTSLTTESDRQMILKMVERLITNGCIDALNEADQILRAYAELIPEREKLEIDLKFNDQIWKYLENTLDDPQDLANFSDRFPHLVIRSVDQIMHLEGKKMVNSLKGFLLFLTKEFKEEAFEVNLQNLFLLGNSLKKFVKYFYFEDILPELKAALGTYVEALLNRLESIWDISDNPLMQGYNDQLIEKSTYALKNLNLHTASPLHYRLLWNKLLMFHLRTLMHLEDPSQQQVESILNFYKESRFEAFQEINYSELSLYGNQLTHLTNHLPHEVLERHQAFFIEAGLYSERFFSVIISKLNEPDDRLLNSIMETEKRPAIYTLQLLKRIKDAKSPVLEQWILSQAPTDWFLRGDEIGTLLRSKLNRAPQETHLSILGSLIASKTPSPKADQLLQIFSSQRLYPSALLESLLSTLNSIKCSEDQREEWISIFLNQDLNFFPWEWMVKTSIFQRIAKIMLKNGYLPDSLEKKLQSAPHFADAFFPFLVGSTFSLHLNLIQLWIERLLSNKKIKLDHALIEKHVKALLDASTGDIMHLQRASNLLLHPSLSKSPHLMNLFGRLVDCILKELFEGSDLFTQKAIQFKELANEFPNAKYCEDPSIVEGFSLRPNPKLALKPLFQAVNATLFHYLDFVLFFDEKKLNSTKEKLAALEQDLQAEGVTLNFDDRFHEPLHWLLIEKLLHYPVKNDAERSVVALFARVQLHEYAMNHRKDPKKLLTANDQIFFMSDFQHRGSFWLEQLAYSMFADEKRINLNDRQRRMIIQDLIEAEPEILRGRETAHTKPIHDFFMGLIQAATPASLEIVERLRTELCIDPNPALWAKEGVEAEKAFCQNILPLLESLSDFTEFFLSKPYLLRSTFDLLAKKPECISKEVRSKLLSLMMTDHETLNLLKPRYLMELWKADPEISTDQSFIAPLLICAEQLRQSIQDCTASGQVPQCFNVLHLLAKPPLSSASPVMYRRLWQTMHEWLLVKTLSLAAHKQTIWIYQLKNLIETSNRDALLCDEDSLRPYLTDVLNRINNRPRLDEYKTIISNIIN